MLTNDFSKKWEKISLDSFQITREHQKNIIIKAAFSSLIASMEMNSFEKSQHSQAVFHLNVHSLIVSRVENVMHVNNL